MVVLVGFRRARWLYRFLVEIAGWIPGLPRFLHKHRSWLGPNIWYVTALFFTQHCTGKNCKWCRLRKNLPPHQPGTPHVIKMVSVDEPDHQGVCVTVDLPLDNPEAWVFVEMRNVSESAAMAFFQSEGEKGYNHRGAAMSQLGVCSRGVQSDLVTSHIQAYFCTELIATFVQRCSGHEYGLAPCNTVASELFRCMARRNPTMYVYAGSENRVFLASMLKPLPQAGDVDRV